MSQLHFKLISAFAEMLDSFEIGKVFAPDKLLLYYEFLNIYKGEQSIIWTCILLLKNMGILKGSAFFLISKKKKKVFV